MILLFILVSFFGRFGSPSILATPICAREKNAKRGRLMLGFYVLISVSWVSLVLSVCLAIISSSTLSSRMLSPPYHFLTKAQCNTCPCIPPLTTSLPNLEKIQICPSPQDPSTKRLQSSCIGLMLCPTQFQEEAQS